MTQDAEFYSKKETGLWDTIMHKELNLTEKQEEALLAERTRIIHERRNLLECDRMIEQFRKEARKHLDETHNALLALGDHLKPEQIARFLLWVPPDDARNISSHLGARSAGKFHRVCLKIN
eukprot:1130525-Amorphochlora_amoeboformis.AAC.1